MNILSRLLIIISIPGAILMPGCSSANGGKGFESTIAPGFDASAYQRAYVCYGEHAGFLKTDINGFFAKAGLTVLSKDEFLQEHGPHDLYVTVAVDKSFTIFSDPPGNPDAAYIPPATATLEIRNAANGKQLMSCTYIRGFFRDAGYGECAEMLIIELSKVFKTHADSKLDGSDKETMDETVLQAKPKSLSGAKDTQAEDYGIQPISKPSGNTSSDVPSFPFTRARGKK